MNRVIFYHFLFKKLIVPFLCTFVSINQIIETFFIVVIQIILQTVLKSIRNLFAFFRNSRQINV